MMPPTPRSEYDFGTMNRYKIKDSFEFSHDLDMFPYTVEGLKCKDAQERGEAASAPWAEKSQNLTTLI